MTSPEPPTRPGSAIPARSRDARHVVVAGGTGLLGSALTARLTSDGHTITLLTRTPGRQSPPHPADPGTQRVTWVPNGTTGPWASVLDGADIVVNLAGESIAAGRWTQARKDRMLESRVHATKSLVAAIRAVPHPPRVFVSASAVGYYGSRGDEVLTEESAAGSGFLADVCRAWEREAHQAASEATRVVIIRTGVVLARNGGALERMALPFRLFVGGPLGSGRQFVPWIHLADWVSMVTWALATDRVRGPLNVVAPEPATQAAFARALGQALHRPSLVPTPAIALRLALGEMADALLLASQRVVPAKATELGFTFAFPELRRALQDLLSR